MSYDLMVFNPEAAPSGHAEFLDWYDKQMQWDGGRPADKLARIAPALRAWFDEMTRQYPAIHGEPRADESAGGAFVLTDYTIGQDIIYASFPAGRANPAYKHMFALAGRHRIGFFDASSRKGEVWLPDGSDGLTLACSA